MENSRRRLPTLKPKLGFLMLCHPYEEGREEAPSLFEKAVLELKKPWIY